MPRGFFFGGFGATDKLFIILVVVSGTCAYLPFDSCQAFYVLSLFPVNSVSEPEPMFPFACTLLPRAWLVIAWIWASPTANAEVPASTTSFVVVWFWKAVWPCGVFCWPEEFFAACWWTFVLVEVCAPSCPLALIIALFARDCELTLASPKPMPAVFDEPLILFSDCSAYFYSLLPYFTLIHFFFEVSSLRAISFETAAPLSPLAELDAVFFVTEASEAPSPLCAAFESAFMLTNDTSSVAQDCFDFGPTLSNHFLEKLLVFAWKLTSLSEPPVPLALEVAPPHPA